MNKIKFLILISLFRAMANASYNKQPCDNASMTRNGSLEKLSLLQILDCHPCDCLHCCICALVCIPAIAIVFSCDKIQKLCCESDQDKSKKGAK